MIKKLTLTLFILLLLVSCVPGQQEMPTSTPLPPATATIPPTSTPEPPTPTSGPPACKDTAVLVADVTYPDNAKVAAGEKFTKTWKIENTGGCPWTGYTVAFVSGDRMEAPDSVPVSETKPKASVEVSVELIAPSTDGSYTANFELRNAQGKSIPVGTEPTFWVKITAGEGGDPLGVEQRIGSCEYTENSDLVQQMIELFNQTRGGMGRKPLTVNEKLMAAAQAHSLDMACNNTKFLLHRGSDGSYTGERLEKVGYTNAYYFELLGVGLPQDSVTEWKRHDNTWPAVIDTYVTQIGVGYVYSKASRFGGYWTVIVGATE